MWGSLISFIAELAVNIFMKLRAANRDEEIGVLKTINKQNAEALKDEQIAKNVSDRIDSLPDAKLDSLSDKLNNRH